MVGSRRVTGAGSARTEGARRATGVSADGAALGSGALAPGQRWSASRKRDVVLRPLRGESLDAVSRELGLEVYRLEAWKARALAGIELGLKAQAGEPLAAELDAAKRHIGELSMENELLRERARVAERRLPLATRRSRRCAQRPPRRRGGATVSSGCVARGSGRARRSTRGGLVCGAQRGVMARGARGPSPSSSNATTSAGASRSWRIARRSKRARNTSYAMQRSANVCPRNRVRYTRGMPTFEEAAAKVLALHRPGWRNAKHAAQWATTLQEYAHPHLGSLPVSEVTTADVLTVLTAIWHDKPETARRVRQRIGAVMKWAVAKGYRQDNPAGDALAQALPRHTVVRRHLRALPHGEVAGAIQVVRASRASAPVKLAFEFLVLTAARSGEVRLATWDEMDLDAAVWLVPGARMKAKRDHRVPLSGRALAILRDA